MARSIDRIKIEAEEAVQEAFDLGAESRQPEIDSLKRKLDKAEADLMEVEAVLDNERTMK